MLTLPILASARDQAEAFAREQSNPTKLRQVYLNTLAVQVVESYLQMMDIPTDRESSHCWQYADRHCTDVADLAIPGLGYLECRPTQDETLHVPPEVWSERIGYVGVEIDQDCRSGKILGFMSAVETETVSRQQLQPLEALLERLQPQLQQQWGHLRLGVQLGQWLNQQFEARWQALQTPSRPPALAFLGERFAQLDPQQPDATAIAALEDLLATTTDEETRWRAAEALWTMVPQHAATGVRRMLDLGLQLHGEAVALMVAILPKPNQQLAVLLRVYPTRDTHLPPELALAGLYPTGEAFLTVQSKASDNYIQCKFTAEPGEQFHVQVALAGSMLTERFTA
jgi:Protein of unknown function (DUF1822)